MQTLFDQAPEELKDRLKGRWWIRLRRAFYVPDLVGDRSAFHVITQVVGLEAGTDTFDCFSAARALIWTVLDLGNRGQLDDLFFGERLRDALRQQGVDPDPVQRIESPASRLAVVLPQTQESRAGWQTMTDYLLKTLRTHVRRWPYEASSGEYLPRYR